MPALGQEGLVMIPGVKFCHRTLVWVATPHPIALYQLLIMLIGVV